MTETLLGKPTYGALLDENKVLRERLEHRGRVIHELLVYVDELEAWQREALSFPPAQ